MNWKSIRQSDIDIYLWSAGAQDGGGLIGVTLHPGPFSIHQERCMDKLNVRTRSEFWQDRHRVERERDGRWVKLHPLREDRTGTWQMNVECQGSFLPKGLIKSRLWSFEPKIDVKFRILFVRSLRLEENHAETRLEYGHLGKGDEKRPKKEMNKGNWEF